jgi:hypothetical protein
MGKKKTPRQWTVHLEPVYREASAKAREFEKWCGQNEGDNSAPRMLKNRPAIVPLKTEV